MARVERTQGPVKLDHENGSRFALVQAFVSGRDLVGYVDEAKAQVTAKYGYRQATASSGAAAWRTSSAHRPG